MRITMLALLYLLLHASIYAQKNSYRFNGNGISRAVPENYLEIPGWPIGYSQEATIKTRWHQ